MKLRDKRVLITAAGQGIGEATAKACLREGARVFATDLYPQKLAKLGATGIYAMDVRNTRTVETVMQAVGPVDILINCAGQVDTGSILESDEIQWSSAIDINFRGMVRTIRAALPAMLERGGGSIINIASVVSSIKAAPKRCVYGTTKAAVIGLTKSVALDFIDRGIRCNAVCPGTIDTPSLAERISSHVDPAEARHAFIHRQPMKRLGTPEEIAALVVFLGSDASAFTTGAIHVVDGGFSL